MILVWVPTIANYNMVVLPKFAYIILNKYSCSLFVASTNVYASVQLFMLQL